MEGEGLKFALGAISDDCHDACTRARQGLRNQGRGRGSAYGSCQRQFAEQCWIAAVDIGQDSEGHDRQHASLTVVRVTIHVFERVLLAVVGGHQLDHTVC
ncbi:hypothetical protein D9M73_205230 [compost metagenome]